MASNQEMMDRISQLTNAIQQQRNNNTTHGYSYRPTYRPNVYQHNTYNNTSYRPSYRPAFNNYNYNNTYRPSSYSPSKSHHRQLINEKDNTIVKSVDNSGRQQVSVNGVEFVVKGKKLVRKDVLDHSTPQTSHAPKYLIRKIKR